LYRYGSCVGKRKVTQRPCRQGIAFQPRQARGGKAGDGQSASPTASGAASNGTAILMTEPREELRLPGVDGKAALTPGLPTSASRPRPKAPSCPGS
jgi:hypothetical protein